MDMVKYTDSYMEDIANNFNYKKEVKTLKEWAKAYYINDDPIATDKEYDELYNKCKTYERIFPEKIDKGSPTQKIIGSVVDGFDKFKHPNRMWSQEDIFETEDLLGWLDKLNNEMGSKQVFVAEPKLDGLSLKLYYKDGRLRNAVTRGDGETGEDVLNNALVIESIPKRIPYDDYLEVSGEILMTNKMFLKINEERSKNNEKLFANPRNAAAGTLRTLDSSIVKERDLVFMAWGVDEEFLPETKTIYNVHKALMGLGFKSMFKLMCMTKNPMKIIKTYNDMIKVRDKLDVGLDGMVVKVNDRDNHKEIGYTNKHPKWSCAMKFPPVEVVTTIEDIYVQVGRTGKITPVALLTPVFIDGSTVERVTLHNFEEIDRKDYRILDQVTLIKSGDIIPKLVKVFKRRRADDSEPFNFNMKCPVCKSKLEKIDANHFCVNKDCKGKLCKKIEFYASRDQMNIDSLGESVVKDLVYGGLINDFADLFKLDYERLHNARLNGVGDKKIKKLLKAIENCKGVELYKFISSLGIPNVGRTAAKAIITKYGKDIFDLTLEQLLNVDGVGKGVAEGYLNHIVNNKDEVMSLYNTVKPVNTIKSYDTIASITGTFDMSRKEIVSLLDSKGIGFSSSINRKINILIVGDNPSSKLDKAKKIEGIKIVTLNDIKEGL